MSEEQHLNGSIRGTISETACGRFSLQPNIKREAGTQTTGSSSGDVKLNDLTHQINCGLYLFWHTILIDEGGLRRSLYPSRLPVRNGVSF